MPDEAKKSRGGARAGAGRKKAERLTDNKVATRVLAQAKVEKLWLEMIERDLAHMRDPQRGSSAGLRETLKYLENRSLGNCVDTVNHLHDKPIEMNVNLKMSELIREVRERKQNYERSRK